MLLNASTYHNGLGIDSYAKRSARKQAGLAPCQETDEELLEYHREFMLRVSNFGLMGTLITNLNCDPDPPSQLTWV